MTDRALGTDTPKLRPQGESPLKRRYHLQSLAARLLPEHRVAECHRAIAPAASTVPVMFSAEQGRAWFRNLVTCNRVWECPVCAQRISAERADELSAALVAARRLKWTPVLISLTMRHGQDDGFAELVAGLLAAWRSFTSGREFQDLKTEYFWQGAIRSVEVTYGASGWHPHLHVVALLGVDIHGNHQLVAGLRRWVTERWLHCLELHGYDASDAHGVDVTEADEDIAAYIAKFGREPEGSWTTAQEIGRAPVKRGRHDNLTPFDLLAAYGLKPDDEFFLTRGIHVRTPARAGALFVEYVEAMTGRNQLVWSRGLRELLEMAEELPTEELPTETPAQDSVELVALSADRWKQVCKAELRGDLLTAASAGALALAEWLRQHGLQVQRVDLSQFDMPNRGHWERRGRVEVWGRD